MLEIVLKLVGVLFIVAVAVVVLLAFVFRQYFCEDDGEVDQEDEGCAYPAGERGEDPDPIALDEWKHGQH